MIEPIGAAARAQVCEATEACVVRAEACYERRFDRIPVVFDLRGTTAGMYKVVGSKRCIRYNPWIFAKYFEENLAETVPHEVAHFIVDDLFGLRNIKPHGREWQAVMAALGANPEVTFKLDLTGVPRRAQRSHRYRCPCKVHEISTTRHNRVQRGKSNYLCRECNSRLVYLG